jgi:hypothetical protein
VPASGYVLDVVQQLLVSRIVERLVVLHAPSHLCLKVLKTQEFKTKQSFFKFILTDFCGF